MVAYAVVVGGTSGIGLAAASALAPLSDLVIIAGRDIDAGHQAQETLRAQGVNATYHRVDVTSSEDVIRLFDTAAASGRNQLRYAVNAAGYETALAPTVDGDEGDFDKAIAVNFKGVWLCMREELRHFGGGPGRIVNVTSVQTARPGRLSGVYGATKAGVEALTRSAALEVSQTTVTVNAVAPGAVDTPMRTRLALDPLAALVPVPPGKPAGRIAQPSAIAAVIAFLCSDEAAYINGHVLRCDGASSL